jgi:ribosomal protein S27E
MKVDVGVPHTFETCPECGDDLSYPTQSDVQCSGCGSLFVHEIRAGGRRHLLWSFTHEDGMDEVVGRADYGTEPADSVDGGEQ